MLESLFKALDALAARRKLVVSLAVIALILFAGRAVWRHWQRAIRATAWMRAEFDPLGKSIDEILSHENGSLAPKVPGAIAYQIDRKIARHGAKALSEAEGKFHAVYQLCAEARARGFEAYFNSPDGGDARKARDGFAEIGAAHTAAIVERAMAVFPGVEVPSDLSRRRELIVQTAPAARPVWQQCDEQILKIDEPLKRLLMDYTKKKKNEFGFQ